MGVCEHPSGSTPKARRVVYHQVSAPTPCHVLQAFSAAVQTILHGQTCALQQLPEAVTQRRLAEQSDSIKAAAGVKQRSRPGPPAVTVLEVVLHTQKLQVIVNQPYYLSVMNCKAFAVLCIANLHATSITRLTERDGMW